METIGKPAEGDLKVWYIPQLPMSAYEVDIVRHSGESDSAYLQRAAETLNAIIGLSIFEFENRIKPDYSDATGIMRWEVDGDGGFDWFEVDESEYEDVA
jgi:hypothetical protein